MSRIGSTAPVEVALTGLRSMADVLWLANTRHGPGGHWFARPVVTDPDHDHLADGDASRYLTDHRVAVPPDPPDARVEADLRAIVEMVRGLPAGGGWTPAMLALREQGRYRVADGAVGSTAAGWRGWIEDALLPLGELVRLAGQGRVRVCGGPGCGLLFVDASRAGTRRWCDDAGCGNRVRVRRSRTNRVPSVP